MRTPAEVKLTQRNFSNAESEEMTGLTRFLRIICGAAFMCVLCLTAVCLAENRNKPYAGTWELASYRAYKTVLAGPSPTMGLDLSDDGSGNLRLRSGATIPVNWKADEYGLRMSKSPKRSIGFTMSFPLAWTP